MTADHTATRANAALRPVPFRVSAGVAAGSVLQPLNSSMIAVAIIAIAAQFSGSTSIAWVISGLYIATAVTAPMAGKLGVVFGARRVYLFGLALVALGSLAGIVAPTLGWLIFARVLLGIGSATQYPNAMTMIRDYSDRHGSEPRSAIATLAMCAQGVVALGPTLGGLLVGAFGWQSIMWVNFPVVILAATLVVRFAPPARFDDGTRTARQTVLLLDLPGAAAFLAVVSSTMFFLLSLTDEPLWWLVPVWVAAVAAFVEWERRAHHPFIDIRALVHNRPLAATLGRTLVTYTAFYAIFFGIPQWLQHSRGMSPITAGLTMLPVAVVGVVSTTLASRMYGRFGARPTLAVGTAGLFIGGLLLVLVESSTAPIVVLLMVGAVLGIPNGFNNMGNQNLISAVTSTEDVGTAIGMYRTVQYIGANFASVVLALTGGTALDDTALHHTGWFIAVVGALLLVGVAASKNMNRVRSIS